MLAQPLDCEIDLDAPATRRHEETIATTGRDRHLGTDVGVVPHEVLHTLEVGLLVDVEQVAGTLGRTNTLDRVKHAGDPTLRVDGAECVVLAVVEGELLDRPLLGRNDRVEVPDHKQLDVLGGAVQRNDVGTPRLDQVDGNREPRTATHVALDEVSEGLLAMDEGLRRVGLLVVARDPTHRVEKLNDGIHGGKIGDRL